MIDVFSEYIHPVNTWIYAHPHWALLATFLVSFSESLAFVGSIIPGSVTMTAFGILAGSGVMRIDLTLIAATLGAIAGDGASYSIGRIFSDRLTVMWPFSRYPHWLDYAKDYFVRHGGKSVLIGRFTGPLRSLIPIIAGMMGMNRLHFFVANVISAIGWAFLYVMPGVLIGAASNELSPQTASKLFMVILCLLVISWLGTLGLKWVFIHISKWLRYRLNTFWIKLLQYPVVGRWCRFVTPNDEVDHFSTAAMVFLFLILMVLTPIFIHFSIHNHWANILNEAVYQFCLSIRTHVFDTFFIIIRLDISYLSLLSFSLTMLLYAIYHADWRLLKFWISLIISSSLILALMSFSLYSPHPIYNAPDLSFLAYPTRGLMLATSLFGFLVFYMSEFYKQTPSIILKICLLIALSFAGIALVYLGEDWVINVFIAYIIGFSNALFHWILYRRRSKQHSRSNFAINLSIILLVIATAASSLLYFNTIYNNQKSYTQQFVIQHSTWWNQKQSLLPLYSMNRFGKEIGLMNIQYVGSLESLQRTLENAGWKKQLDSFFYSLLLRVGNQKTTARLPLMTQLYLNTKPSLMMTYGNSVGGKGLILRFWRSNYHVQNQNKVIWIGSIQAQSMSETRQASDLFNPLSLPSKDYKTKKIIINPQKTRPTSSTSTILLLVEGSK